jgi:protein SCO1/2
VKVDSAPTSDLHGAELSTPLHEPALRLTGTSGRPVNLLQATRDKLTLVYFGYTHCPDVCPTTMADLAGALRMLTPAQRARIAVVFITTDPRRDTPPVIKSWLASFNSSFIGLTDDYAKIQVAAKSLGIDLEPPTSTKARRLRQGDHVKLALRFRRSPAITVDVPVKPVGYRPDGT